MPINFFEANDGVHVSQSFDSPTVYMDHWAIRLFSDETSLQDRFVAALMSKGGTLLLSNVSFVEFAQASDPKHCADAERFIERLLPNIFFTDFAFDKVLEQELKESSNLRRFWPSPDLPQLKLFAERSRNELSRLTMRGFIAMTHPNRDELIRSTDEVAHGIITELEAARSSSDYAQRAKCTLPGEGRTRTMVILGELLRNFILDQSASIPKNDMIDLMHTAMPVNCCDFVLIDGPWTERVNTMRQRLAQAGTNMPIARCFSKRKNGVGEFLADLESFSASSQ